MATPPRPWRPFPPACEHWHPPRRGRSRTRFTPFAYRPLRPLRHASVRSGLGPMAVSDDDPFATAIHYAGCMRAMIEDWAEAMGWYTHEFHYTLGVQDDQPLQRQLRRWDRIFREMLFELELHVDPLVESIHDVSQWE